MPSSLLKTFAIAWKLAFVVGVCGCGGGPDLNKADAAVQTALTAWKSKSTPEALAAEHAIDILEPDWRAGYRLVDFEMKQASAQPQQGPRVVAKLTLQRPTGKQITKEVAYEVLFKERTSIGRDPYHAP